MASAELLWARMHTVFTADTEPSRVQAATAALYYSASFLLLTGFAVENYLKASIVKGNLEIASAKGDLVSFPSVLKTHNLLALADRAGLRGEAVDTEFLTRLTKAITWRARYPVPVAVEPRIGHFEIRPTDFDHALSIRRSAQSIVYSPQHADGSLFGLVPGKYEAG